MRIAVMRRSNPILIELNGLDFDSLDVEEGISHDS